MQCKFKEPVGGYELELKMLAPEQLRPGEFQRPVSTGLKNKLMKSIARGFVVPLIVTSLSDDTYEVLDGQHRLEDLVGIIDVGAKIPCLIIPEEFRLFPLMLNTEKSDSIKDKSHKLYKLYMWHLENTPGEPESILAGVVDYQATILSLAFGYMEGVIPSPTLVETLGNKLDGFLPEAFIEAIDERRRRAYRLGEVVQLIEGIAAENDVTDFQLKRAMVSKTTMALWGRKRNLGISFDEGIDMVLEQMATMDWWTFAH